MKLNGGKEGVEFQLGSELKIQEEKSSSGKRGKIQRIKKKEQRNSHENQ